MYFKVMWNIIPILEFICYLQTIVVQSKSYKKQRTQFHTKINKKKVITSLVQSPSYQANCRSAIEGLLRPLRNKNNPLVCSQIQNFVPVLSHAFPFHKE